MKQVDPIQLSRVFWPNTYLYRQQKEIIRSVWENDETVVPAGNKLGKDYVSGRIAILFFLTRQPCRIVTTSAKDDHLRVLWGEINQAISESAVPLRFPAGPLLVTHHEIKRLYKGQICPISYIKGMVAKYDSIAGMQGHHAAAMDGIPHTLFIADECSSVPDEYFAMCRTWAQRVLLIGNPWPCSNYFFRAVEGDAATNEMGGDILAAA